MGVRSSRLAISVFVHWDWSGKSITETELDFTFEVWLVSTKIIKNGKSLVQVDVPYSHYLPTQPEIRQDHMGSIRALHSLLMSCYNSFLRQ